jgi:hypothetical protein
MQLRGAGRDDLPLLVIPHPLGGIDEAGVAERAEVAWPQLRDWLDQVWRSRD